MLPAAPATHAYIGSPIINIPDQSGTLVTTDESTWTHYYHPKSIVYIMVHSDVEHSMDLDKCIMIGIPHYRIIENIFTALKIICALPIHPFFPPTPWQPLIFLLSS